MKTLLTTTLILGTILVFGKPSSTLASTPQYESQATLYLVGHVGRDAGREAESHRDDGDWGGDGTNANCIGLNGEYTCD